MKLKILSWNIWGGNHLKDVLNFLRTADADVIALQEVVADEFGNTAIPIAKKFGYEYVHAIDMEMPATFMPEPLRRSEGVIKFGNAILSKHRIVRHKRLTLSKQEKRIALQADIQVNNTTLSVFSVHLKHSHQKPSKLQDQQADNLIKAVLNHKAIVTGDFNALPESNAIKKISKVLQDTESGPPTPTWSLYREGCTVCLLEDIRYKLDYIFTTKDIKTYSFRVGSSSGSDHLPVLALIEV